MNNPFTDDMAQGIRDDPDIIGAAPPAYAAIIEGLKTGNDVRGLMVKMLEDLGVAAVLGAVIRRELTVQGQSAPDILGLHHESYVFGLVEGLCLARAYPEWAAAAADKHNARRNMTDKDVRRAYESIVSLLPLSVTDDHAKE